VTATRIVALIADTHRQADRWEQEHGYPKLGVRVIRLVFLDDERRIRGCFVDEIVDLGTVPSQFNLLQVAQTRLVRPGPEEA
jgi:hypothetical protein